MFKNTQNIYDFMNSVLELSTVKLKYNVDDNLPFGYSRQNTADTALVAMYRNFINSIYMKSFSYQSKTRNEAQALRLKYKPSDKIDKGRN